MIVASVRKIGSSEIVRTSILQKFNNFLRAYMVTVSDILFFNISPSARKKLQIHEVICRLWMFPDWICSSSGIRFLGQQECAGSTALRSQTGFNDIVLNAVQDRLMLYIAVQEPFGLLVDHGEEMLLLHHAAAEDDLLGRKKAAENADS